MEEAIKLRGVTSLLHFTAEKNLDSIINNGLIPRKIIHKFISEAVFNDDYRLYRRDLYNSFSIGFPNYSMFYKYRKIKSDLKFCVIGFSTDILLNEDCLFCYTNAANSCISNLDESELKGKDAFLKMFDDNIGDLKRSDLNLPDNFPTDHQAEVLVYGYVDPKYIIGVCFDDFNLYQEYTRKYPYLKIAYSSYYYNNRKYALESK